MAKPLEKRFEPGSEELRVFETDWKHGTVTEADREGVQTIVIREAERIEVDLGEGIVHRGFQLVGHKLLPLPIGSTLDQKKGVLYWQPGPGFLGVYDFVFLKENPDGKMTKNFLRIEITPRFKQPEKPFYPFPQT